MYKKLYLHICFFCLATLFSHIATAKFTLLSDEEGLSNNFVTSICKDKTGNLWVGTKKGLNQYDGYNFFPINEFSKLNINCLQYDNFRNCVWIGTDEGLFYLNCDTKQIISCTRISSENAVTNLLVFGKNIIVGFKQKYILQIKQDFSCEVLHMFSKAILTRNKLTIDKKNNLYVLLPEKSSVTKINLLSRKHDFIPIGNANLTSFIKHFDKQVYLGLIDKGVKQLHLENTMPSYLDTLNRMRGDPECIIQSQNSVFMAYRNPSNLYEINTETCQIKRLIENEQSVLSHKLVQSMYHDDFGTIWIGTNKGLVKYTPDNPTPTFEKLFSNSTNPVSTRDILEDSSGNLYIATYAGFYTYNKHRNIWNSFNQILFNGKMNFFYQRTLLNASDRYMYIGTDAHYFVRYDKLNHTFESDFIKNKDADCWKIKSVLSMEMDSRGLVWLGTDKGLVSLDTAQCEVTCHRNDKFNIGLSYVRYIHMLPGNKRFWAGCEEGLFLVDIDKGVVLHLSENSQPALSENVVNCISTDAFGNIWIATSQSGINVLSPDYKNIYTISRKDGLSSNEVYNLLWEDSNKVWISTNNGLNLYNTSTNSIYNYYKGDGLADNEFNQNSALKGRDGKLYFGGINGITCFVPKSLNLYQKPFHIFTSRVTKYDHKTDRIIEFFPNTNDYHIEIEPGDNLLSLSFATNDYTHPELNSYSYKLQGLNNDWTTLGDQNTLRLESLKPGEYDLFVRALKGSRGLTSANTLIYHLRIKHVFYQTVWFYVFITFLFIGIVYFYFHLQLRNLMQLERLRVKIASNLHDDVGSLLTRITMSADNLANKFSQDNEHKEKLQNVSRLSREANIAMSDVLWTIDARNDLTSSMTDRMREHAEDMLIPKGIEVQIDFTEVDQQQKLSPDFRQHLFLLYKEAINNIIKHSRASSVFIQYRQDEDNSLLVIRNNGANASKSQLTTGQGIKNIKMRAEQLKGEASISCENDVFEVLVKL